MAVGLVAAMLLLSSGSAQRGQKQSIVYVADMIQVAIAGEPGLERQTLVTGEMKVEVSPLSGRPVYIVRTAGTARSLATITQAGITTLYEQDGVPISISTREAVMDAHPGLRTALSRREENGSSEKASLQSGLSDSVWGMAEGYVRLAFSNSESIGGIVSRCEVVVAKEGDRMIEMRSWVPVDRKWADIFGCVQCYCFVSVGSQPPTLEQGFTLRNIRRAEP
jgi:hypothetical protein